ncbi:hypothetical protein J11TS1_18010 [Oceanobacillus sp. J11TS1]|nr:hypothetical protein J11TS1_18010 [Oceanobacillus sp. J11TS1]
MNIAIFVNNRILVVLWETTKRWNKKGWDRYCKAIVFNVVNYIGSYLDKTVMGGTGK